MTGDHTSESLQKLRESVFSHFGLEGECEQRRKIYIPRKYGSERSIANEAELIPLLQRHGFEIVQCEQLTFAEEVRIFREAKVVVGPHGGGLSNLVWCSRGTKVFEFFGRTSVRRSFWSICAALDLQHHCAVANELADGTLTIDPALFASALDTVVASQCSSQAILNSESSQ
jgi:capsular polysaccharide biosynthesis protein